jgi:hypothetical protein
MMWGYPYLTAGEGLSRPAASAVMTVLVVIAIVGGPLIGALTAILLIGVVLDLLRPDGNYDLVSFRLAFAVQLPLLAFGVAGMLITRRTLRRRMSAQGREVPPWRDVWRSGRWRRL